MIKINALGDACPLPVIKAKKALRENSDILITVDNEIATQNLNKMGTQLGFQVEVTKESENLYHVLIHRAGHFDDCRESHLISKIQLQKDSYTTEGSRTPAEHNLQEKPYIVVIASTSMGVGDNELGQTLMKAFIYSLTEQDVLPSHLLFYNEGAKLTTGLSAVLEDLKVLIEAKVEILTCGACLDYFNLKESLAVGEVTNMYHILELMSRHHVVRP